MLEITQLRQSTKTYRRARGLTQADLGRVLGISDSAVSNWEKGKSTLSAQSLMVLSGLIEEWIPLSPDNQRTAATHHVTTAKCPGCHEVTPITYDGRRLWHCGFCGHELGTLCTQCSTVNPPAARYCYDCGAAIQRRPIATYQPIAAEAPAPYKAKPKK